MNLANTIPVIPNTKQYWLVRTQGGQYYSEYRKGNFIAINWDDITIGDIKELSEIELIKKVKQFYPEQTRHKRTANQLRIFSRVIRKGDAVIITSHSSNELTIGEVLEDDPYFEPVSKDDLDRNPKKCPFTKRKKVKWLKTFKKFELNMKLFQLLQHAQHTISSANDYADSIEGLIHDFFIRGDNAQLILSVKKEGKIPMSAFFPLGTEILNIAAQFNEFSKDIKLDIDGIDTEVNINSPGKITLKGSFITISVIGLILVALAGGKFNVNFPEGLGGGSFDIELKSLVEVTSDFLDRYQERQHKDLVIQTYMKDLHVETPQELSALYNSLEGEEKVLPATTSPAEENGTSEKQ
jgi:restriction system protein